MSRDSDLGWAAGIIDGEGCILLNIYRAGNDCYVLRVIVTNTDVSMLHRLKEIFGLGNIIPRPSNNPKHKMRWYWEVSSKKAEQVLTLVEPYLVSKRKQAQLGLLSRTYMGKHGVNKPNPNKEELAWLRRQLQELK